MAQRITVGIDNGASGSIGIITPGGIYVGKVPTLDYLHYGKKGTVSRRLDRYQLNDILRRWLGVYGAQEPTPGAEWVGYDNIRVFIERPFSGRFINAVVPAHRFFESTICVMEDFEDRHGLGYEVVDSGEWQKSVLGAKVKGSTELKRASKLRGLQLYPQHADAINKHGDADGLLIAHHYHQLYQ